MGVDPVDFCRSAVDWNFCRSLCLPLFIDFYTRITLSMPLYVLRSPRLPPPAHYLRWKISLVLHAFLMLRCPLLLRSNFTLFVVVDDSVIC